MIGVEIPGRKEIRWMPLSRFESWGGALIEIKASDDSSIPHLDKSETTSLLQLH